MSAADALSNFITPLLGVGWRVQFGRWIDGEDKTDRYAVIKPANGLPAELVREPHFTVSLIGPLNEAGDIAYAAANAIVEAARASSADGAGVVLFSSGEPAFHPTTDGRPVFELAMTAITT